MENAKKGPLDELLTDIVNDAKVNQDRIAAIKAASDAEVANVKRRAEERRKHLEESTDAMIATLTPVVTRIRDRLSGGGIKVEDRVGRASETIGRSTLSIIARIDFTLPGKQHEYHDMPIAIAFMFSPPVLTLRTYTSVREDKYTTRGVKDPDATAIEEAIVAAIQEAKGIQAGRK